MGSIDRPPFAAMSNLGVLLVTKISLPTKIYIEGRNTTALSASLSTQILTARANTYQFRKKGEYGELKLEQ